MRQRRCDSGIAQVVVEGGSHLLSIVGALRARIHSKRAHHLWTARNSESIRDLAIIEYHGMRRPVGGQEKGGEINDSAHAPERLQPPL
jgi:hypothetical protein